jgi:carboxyl-terminal processing protease
VNQNSASAAEIVAACLQDHDRAVVIGERTYGKGTVQQMLEMETGKSLLKLTTADFWRPSGDNIHRAPEVPESATWGVSPDHGYIVRLSPNDYALYRRYRAERDVAAMVSRDEAEEAAKTDEPPLPHDFVDVQLEKAVEYLRKKLGQPAV